MDAGDKANEEENRAHLDSIHHQPPSYETAEEYPSGEEEDRDEISKLMLLKEGDRERSSEEKKREHDRKIKKLIADLRRECSVEEVAPEEIEMLNVGDDDLSESDMSSVPSSARRERRETLQGASSAATEEEVREETVDTTDASLSRLSRRLSMIMATSEADANGGTDEKNVEPPQDDVTVENGENRRKRSGVFGMIEGSPTRMLIVLFSVLFCLGLLLLVILLPKSFVYVEYYEYALSKNSVTETVDYDTVYDGGCYLLRPQDKLIRFDATAHSVQQNLEIVENSGLSIKLDIALQYFLKRNEIPQLFKKYYLSYNTVIESLVESAVKNAAVTFSLDQYRLSRQEVERKIFKKIRENLAGDCCDACCPDKCGERKVDCSQAACKPLGNCHPGHHVEVKYFQLGAIEIPDSVIDRHIQTIVLQIEADREVFYQRRAIEAKKTEREAQDIKNKAKELIQEAKAQHRVIRMKAEADKFATLEKARQQALKNIFSMFNITQEDTKLSYIYTHALAEVENNLRFSYAYQGLGAFSP